MDQMKVGKFIAALRKEQDLTQQQLGEKIGVTNKTISRWENGNYMPDISMLQLLSEALAVSISEIIAGERLTDQKFRDCADQIVLDAVANEAFSMKEKTAFWKKKWKREHLVGIILQIVLVIAAYAAVWLLKENWRPLACALVQVGWLFLYGYNRNRMMIYVEKKLYD